MLKDSVFKRAVASPARALPWFGQPTSSELLGANPRRRSNRARTQTVRTPPPPKVVGCRRSCNPGRRGVLGLARATAVVHIPAHEGACEAALPGPLQSEPWHPPIRPCLANPDLSEAPNKRGAFRLFNRLSRLTGRALDQ